MIALVRMMITLNRFNQIRRSFIKSMDKDWENPSYLQNKKIKIARSYIKTLAKWDPSKAKNTALYI